MLISKIWFVATIISLEIFFNRPRAKKKKLHGYKEDPFLFMEETDPAWKPIR